MLYAAGDAEGAYRFLAITASVYGIGVAVYDSLAAGGIPATKNAAGWAGGPFLYATAAADLYLVIVGSDGGGAIGALLGMPDTDIATGSLANANTFRVDSTFQLWGSDEHLLFRGLRDSDGAVIGSGYVWLPPLPANGQAPAGYWPRVVLWNYLYRGSWSTPVQALTALAIPKHRGGVGGANMDSAYVYDPFGNAYSFVLDPMPSGDAAAHNWTARAAGNAGVDTYFGVLPGLRSTRHDTAIAPHATVVVGGKTYICLEADVYRRHLVQASA